MEERIYIGRTEAYYGDDDYVFIPKLWDYSENPDELAGEVHLLNEEGYNLMMNWIEDDSLGYDLCNGKASGYAAEYSSEEIFSTLCEKEYSIAV